MTTDPERRGTRPRLVRSNRWLWTFAILATAALGLLALLPWITMWVLVVLWSLGGSGSNK
jgi:hypothetical protein